MSPQAKVDLGVKAEAMLASWPAPSSDDAAWESRAAKIVAAATNASRADDARIAALFAKPALDPEPGELESSNVSAVSARSASGVKAMSDSNPESPGRPASPSAAPTTSGAVSKRPSLKELAARASQANASGSPSMRPSAPASTPPPAAEAVSQDKQARPSSPMPSVPPPKASVPPPRSIEAMKEDSGRVDLNAIHQAAAPAQVAAVEAAKPAANDLVSDAVGEDKPAAANDTGEGAKVKSISEARTKKAKKKSEAAKQDDAVKVAEAAPVAETAKKAESEGGGNAKWAILAILGLAAGGFLVFRNKQQPPAPAPTAVVQEKQEAAQPAVDQQKIVEAPKPASTGLSIDSLPAAEPTVSAKTAPVKVAAANTEEAAPPPAPPEPVAPTALPTAGSHGKVGDLSEEMAKAVGGSADKPVNADDATPAAAKTGSQTIPEQPSPGAANAAVRPLTPGAKACVAGADDISHANITFSSSGTVSSVNVSGWAAKNGKAECIKAAFKGANVGPFAKPSFNWNVPIRP